MNKKNILLSLILISSTAVFTSCSSPSVNSADFNSMQQCLSSIKNSTGEELEIVTDKPDNVSGVLKDSRKLFGCQKKSSGSKGTYYNGYYHD